MTNLHFYIMMLSQKNPPNIQIPNSYTIYSTNIYK